MGGLHNQGDSRAPVPQKPVAITFVVARVFKVVASGLQSTGDFYGWSFQLRDSCILAQEQDTRRRYQPATIGARNSWRSLSTLSLKPLCDPNSSSRQKASGAATATSALSASPKLKPSETAAHARAPVSHREGHSARSQHVSQVRHRQRGCRTRVSPLARRNGFPQSLQGTYQAILLLRRPMARWAQCCLRAARD